AWSYVGSNLRWIIASIGRPTDNFQGNFINLGIASQAQRYIALNTRIFTATVGILAICGIVRRLRHRYYDVPAVLLMGAPLLMLAGNAYGGEILFRLYYFALPCLVFFIAALLFPSQAVVTLRRNVAASFLLCLCLFAGFLLPYYGRESQNYESDEELAATQYVYDHAPAGALLGNVAEPLLYHDYEDYSYLTLTDLPREERLQIVTDPADQLAMRMRRSQPPTAYFTITRNQRAFVTATGELPAGSLERIDEALLHSPDFTVVFRNRDAIVFSLILNTGGSS
ncbi:MAG: hypothetical protein LC793_17495, partial [Thermomicrobia bacterium]|nr:hypothetical protein [Thermomicrobia bacterium]